MMRAFRESVATYQFHEIFWYFMTCTITAIVLPEPLGTSVQGIIHPKPHFCFCCNSGKRKALAVTYTRDGMAWLSRLLPILLEVLPKHPSTALGPYPHPWVIIAYCLSSS